MSNKQSSYEDIYMISRAAYYWHHFAGIFYTFIMFVSFAHILAGVGTFISFLGAGFGPFLIKGKINDLAENREIQKDLLEKIKKERR